MNITVADNIDVSVSDVSGHVSDNQSVSTSPTVGFTGLSVTLPVVSQVGSVSSHTSCPIVPPCQSEQLRYSTGPKPLLVDTVLSFIAAYCLKGDIESLKKTVIERFSSDDVDAAKKCLWDCCNSVLLAKGLPFHARRDSDRRSQLEANLADLLSAFDILDSSDSLPTICCEATSLLRLPPLSLDPVAEQVESNSQALKSLSSVIERLEEKLSNLLLSGSPSHTATGSQPGMGYAAAASSSPPPETSKSPPVIARKNSVSHSSSANDRSCNVVLFGLPEGRSFVESKKVVDEILEFLSGKSIQIKDMFRLGKFISQTTSSRLRPVLIKLGTAWDRKLVLLRKSSLKDFHIKRLFLREDVPPEHKLRVRKVVSSLHSSDLNQGSSTTAISHPSPSTAALTPSHSSADNPSSNVGSPPATVCAESSKVVHSALATCASKSLSHSSSSTFSSSVVLGSLIDSNGST